MHAKNKDKERSRDVISAFTGVEAGTRGVPIALFADYADTAYSR